MAKGANWKRITESGLITDKPCTLLAIGITVSVAGAQISIYDGRDADVGRLLGEPKTASQLTNWMSFGCGFDMENGIFITLGTNVDEVTAAFTYNDCEG